MSIMKFIRKNSSHSALHISSKEECTEETVNTEFLGLQIDNHINWKDHIEEMIAKLYNNSPTNTHLLIFTELFCIKNSKNSCMFQSMRDHHQGVCTTSVSV